MRVIATTNRKLDYFKRSFYSHLVEMLRLYANFHGLFCSKSFFQNTCHLAKLVADLYHFQYASGHHLLSCDAEVSMVFGINTLYLLVLS